MVTITIDYEGELRTSAEHGPSGAILATDAPKDNEGRGEAFSPTDLLAASLGSCMLTIMGIAARRKGLRIEGTKATVKKHMCADPLRRVAKLEVTIEFPSGIPLTDRSALEHAAATCPVSQSIRQDIEVPLVFRYT